MPDPASFDFTKFVPGFDFLKNFTPRDGAAPSSATTGWIAPTLDPQELDKRIQELKTVQFWLEQNTKAVAATIQALEVQRMTLNALKGMNMNFHDLAESLKAKPTTTPSGTSAKSKYSFTPAEPAHTEPAPAVAPDQTSATPKAVQPQHKPRSKKAGSPGAAVDPMHWWGALTDQFQHIATHAMADMTERAHAHASSQATQSTEKPAAKRTAKPTQTKASAGKPAARKTTVRQAATRSKR